MDIRPFDPNDATDVTQELGEDRPEQNRLFRLPDGRIVKVKSFWSDRPEPKIPGQREIEITASLCDERGQALSDENGHIISEVHYLTPSPGGVDLDEQIDEGQRRWAVAFARHTTFWQKPPPGVAAKPPKES